MKASLTKRIISLISIFLSCASISIASEPNDITTEIKSEDSNSVLVNHEIEPNESSVKENNTFDFDLPVQNHSIEIGSEIYFFDYREPGGISDKGAFIGGILNYTYRGWVPKSSNAPLPENGISLHADLRYANGDVDYDGSLSNGTPYKINGIGYNAYETRFLCGLDFIDEEWIATISAGIGYRYSNDDSSFDPYGYERESNYLYVPFAYQLDSKFENNWSWGFTMEADFLLEGLQKTYLSDVGDYDIENKQKNGVGLRGSIRFQRKTISGVLMIEPFFRFWSINDSELEYIPPYFYWEPRNTTTEIGLQVKWKF